MIKINKKNKYLTKRKSPPPFTEEHRKNLSENNPRYWLGKKRIKKSNSGSFKKGMTPWNKNIKNCFSEETNKKRSENTKGKHFSLKTEFKKGHPAPKTAFKKGNIITEKIRKKMSESHKKIGSGKRLSHKRGKEHWNYQGGINPISDTIRKSLEIKLWKKACMERDNFTDVKTGQRGGKLVVHHINNFADFPELRTSISNGITLSKESHEDFHKIYGYKNNTREQLEEFLKNK